MLQPPSPGVRDCPVTSLAGQLSLPTAEDSTLQAWLIHRLSIGDLITYEGDGTWLVEDRP
jgi:hypothetical protein